MLTNGSKRSEKNYVKIVFILMRKKAIMLKMKNVLKKMIEKLYLKIRSEMKVTLKKW